MTRSSSTNARRPSRLVVQFAKVALMLTGTPGLGIAACGDQCYPVRVVGATYPRLAQLARIEGVVRVKALIADDGLVRDVVVESGHRLLKEVVTESLRQWRFSLPECKSSADGFQMLWRFTFSGSCEMHGKACRQTFVYEHPGSVSVVSELPNVNP